MEMKWARSVLLSGTVVMSAYSLLGCASNPPPPDRSTQEIKSDSDRSFEKMKKEERDRGKGPEAPAR